MISPIQTTKISLRALAANRMRSALTVLGIVIGVTAVIVMFAVGTGAREEIAGKMSALGSNMLFIRPNFTPSSGARTTTVATLTVKDGEAIKAECSAVVAVAPTVNMNAQIIRGNANWSTRITGTTVSFLTVKDWSITSGREFTGSEERNSAKVCLLGVTVVKELFQDQDPLGQSVRIG
ncbi:MAG: ABC transporter permease, partial [Synergistales bacterium]|nr:ABC transporter permease [Synergistales bacterium]